MNRRRIAAALVAIYLGSCVLGGAFFVNRSLHRARHRLTDVEHVQATGVATTTGGSLDHVSLEASDGEIQRGWLFSPANANGRSVLLLHGIDANRAAMLTTVPLFLAQGYRVLAVDLRGHGDSGGDLSTFGALERDDLARWIVWLRRPAPDACVYMFGGSLGAGLALQAANTPHLCGVVADSTFDSLRETAFDRIGQAFHAGPWVGRTVLRPGVEFGFLYARLRYGIRLGDASAVTAIAQPGAAVLLIHGMDDDNTAPRQARLIEAANPARVSLWLVPNAGHGGARRAGPAEYQARVLNFLSQHRAPNR